MKKTVKIVLILGAVVLAAGVILGAFFIGRGSQSIGKDAALNIALADLGLDRSQVKDVDVELERRKGASPYYEVDFDLLSNGAEVNYSIDAATGAVLGKNAEGGQLAAGAAPQAADAPAGAPAAAPSGNTEPTVSSPAQAPSGSRTGTQGSGGETAPAANTGSDVIGRDAAIAAALADLGLTENDVFDLDVDLERHQGGSAYYEVDFDTIDTDYKYEIDAVTGEILNSRAKPENVGQNAAAAPAGDAIGRDAALAAALKDAGLQEADVFDIDVELDRDGATVCYEVDFETTATEYEYDVDAVTGEILRSHTEPRD